jgi:hypothetical protein
MFYKTGIDITSDKQMFNFLKGHFEYSTLNSWNGLESIANNVKLYNLGLTGDWCNTLSLLESGEYESLNWMIVCWQEEHPGYKVGFNGRSGGYLVLYEENTNNHVLPIEIIESEDYDEYKRFCKEYYGSVKANRSDLVYYTKLVQDFDKLCDQLRDYCDELSNIRFEVVEMEKTVEAFNDKYFEELDQLDIKPLYCDEEGRVDVSEIFSFLSLFEAFLVAAEREKYGYVIVCTNEKILFLKNKYK